jgi:RND family efflux transporter MFP subunit
LLLGAASTVEAQSSGPAGVHVDPVRTIPFAQSAPVIGRLVATRAGVVAARVSAPVDSFVVEVGDRVNRGETIAVLDDEMLGARRDQASGALAEAQARLATREEQLRLARQELDRLEGLKDSAAFSEARFNDQRQEVAIARAQRASAEAAVKTARADLRVAQIDLQRTEIAAPYPGVVTDRLVESGAYVNAGDDVVRMVSDLALEIEADVPFRRLAGLQPGREVEVGLGDGADRSAAVRAILPEENPRTRTRRVRFVPNFPMDEGRYAAGQSVTVQVPIGDAREVLSVHKDAVIRRNNQAVVYVAIDGEAQIRPVQLGAELGDRFEVLGGVEAGALAVVRGNERLRPGAKLKIEKRRGPASENRDGTAGNNGQGGTAG